jgi:signal peptide peptidase SppA
MRYPHIAQRLFNCPLMIARVKLETILGAIGPRLVLGVESAVSGSKHTRRALDITPEGIAIVSISGTLVRRTQGLQAESGLTSYEAIEEEVLDAATDPAVRGILLDVDSPGGEAGGLPDLMDALKQAGELKPMWAVANDEAFSAAYGIATTAERIYLSRTGGVGSVGVIAVHLDHSQADASAGLAYTIFRGGQYKAEHNSLEPLTDHARQTLQAEVDRLHGMLAQMVAANRGLSTDTIMATQAGLSFGPLAITAGLADAIGTLQDAHEELVRRIEDSETRSTQSTMSHQQEETDMSADMKEASTLLAGEAEAAPDTIQKELDTSVRDTSVVRKDTNVIDLTAEAERRGKQQAFAYVKRVRELCDLAGRPELADRFIEREASVDDVHRTLVDARAQADVALEVTSSHDTVPTTRPAIDLSEVYEDAYARLRKAAS